MGYYNGGWPVHIALWSWWKFVVTLLLLSGAGGAWVYIERKASRSTAADTALLSTERKSTSSAVDRPFQALPSTRLPEHREDQSGSWFASVASSPPFYFERVIISPITTDWTPAQVVVGDVSGDGREDVVLTMDYSGMSGPSSRTRVRIHAQNPDGSLAEPIELEVGSAINFGSSLELADLDRDGLSEIIVGTEKALSIIARRDGNFVQTQYSGQSRALYLAAVDADGDGNLDIFAQSWSEGADIYLGDGRGGIRRIEHISTPPRGYNTVEASDFTADGLPDVIMTNGQGWPLVWVYPVHQSTGLQSPIQIDLQPAQSSPASGMTIADMNRDGRPDLIVATQGHNEAKGIRIFYRGVADAFSNNMLLPTPGTYERPGATAIADIDGNGYPDVVTMFNSHDRMAYFLQRATGFDPIVTVSSDDNPWTNNHYYDNSMTIADVNSDGCLDVVLAEVSSSLRIFYGRNCLVMRPTTSGPCRTELVRGP
jgi:hypothetical protein